MLNHMFISFLPLSATVSYLLFTVNRRRVSPEFYQVTQLRINDTTFFPSFDRTCEATSIGLVDEPKETCTGVRRTETNVAPRHVPALRDFHTTSSERAKCGVGGGAARLFFSLFPVQQTTSGIGHPCKVVF